MRDLPVESPREPAYDRLDPRTLVQCDDCGDEYQRRQLAHGRCVNCAWMCEPWTDEEEAVFSNMEDGVEW